MRLVLARGFDRFRPVVVEGGVCFGFAVGDGGGHQADGAEVLADVEGEHVAVEFAVFFGADAPFLLQGAKEGGAIEAVFLEEDEALGVSHDFSWVGWRSAHYRAPGIRFTYS